MVKIEQPVMELSRYKQSEKLVRLMDKLEAKEIFSTPESKKYFAENLTFEQFQRLIDTVNGLLRDIPSHERGPDGETVALMSQNESVARALGVYEVHYPPRQQDKEALLQEMFELAKTLIKEGNIETAALISAVGINAIHQFMDGNGRTSRLVYFLLTENYTGREEQVERLEKILGEEGRLYVNINPGLVVHEIEDYISSNELGIEPNDIRSPHGLTTLGGGELGENILENTKADFQRYILGDKSGYGFFAVFKFLKYGGKLERVTIKFEEDGELTGTGLRLIDLFKELGPEDYERIIEIYWQLKKKGVSILLNAIAKPESYPLAPNRYERKGDEKTIKEAFIKALDDENRKLFQEVNVQDISSIWNERDSLTFSEQTISIEELDQLSSISKTLNGIVNEERREREALQFDMENAQKEFIEQSAVLEKADYEKHGKVEFLSDEVKKEIFELRRKIYKPILDVSGKYLEKAITYLDSLDIWKTKFTTRNPDPYLTEAQQEFTDSIYYVTRGGQSLRLKKYELLAGGLGGVIQPFTERIFFLDDKGEISDQVVTNSKVVEYYTKAFLRVQNDDTGPCEFESEIRRYDKDGKIVYLNPVNGLVHRGYGVNQIFERG